MKGQSLPLELTIITIGSLIIITGSLTAFDAINSTYDDAVQDYHMQKAHTDTLTSMYHLNSIDQESARITYQTPNKQSQEQKYRITTSQSEVIVETNNRQNTKNKTEIAQITEGESDQHRTTLTKTGNIMVLTEE